MNLIKEINDIINLNKEIPKFYNDFNEMGIKSLILEANINTNDTIEWEEPQEKLKITKTSSEEKIKKRDPIPRKGSGVLLTIDNNNIPGVVSDIQNGNYIISYKSNNEIQRLPPQSREKFKFLKFNKSGNALFKLENKINLKNIN